MIKEFLKFAWEEAPVPFLLMVPILVPLLLVVGILGQSPKQLFEGLRGWLR